MDPPDVIMQPESTGEQPSDCDVDIQSEDDMDLIVRNPYAKLVWEGGVQLLQHLLSHRVLEAETPKQFRDIKKLSKPLQKAWLKACNEELKSLCKRKVFDLVDLPKGHKVIKNRWVFAEKSDGCLKARLVAKGFSQVEGIDFDEIFSPVIRYETVRLILALGALEYWTFSAVDVKTAFLYGKLDEEIYMEQPEGFKIKGKETKVFRLH